MKDEYLELTYDELMIIQNRLIYQYIDELYVNDLINSIERRKLLEDLLMNEVIA